MTRYMANEWCLKFRVVAKCSTSKARASIISLVIGINIVKK